MTLYLIGLGLADEKDISVKGLEIIQRCDIVYLEDYTSILRCSLPDLEKFYGKKIILASREMAEQGEDHIVEEAREKDVAFLVVGDPFSATTHIELLKQAHLLGVPVKVINNASVLTAIGMTGLQLYKFGKTTSIPFAENYAALETPYTVLKENQKMGLHTLFLLDLQPEKKKFMTVNEALDILEKIEARKKEGLVHSKLLVVGCARLGSDDFTIKSGTLQEGKGFHFGEPPHCLIIPGKLHFVEEEMMGMWKKLGKEKN
ncbi:diphthine synthase [Candidatus Woesearchaeota archaeon]|nr:diphthine synthase [Candidatus Woesearchaeota archaeon]